MKKCALVDLAPLTYCRVEAAENPPDQPQAQRVSGASECQAAKHELDKADAEDELCVAIIKKSVCYVRAD